MPPEGGSEAKPVFARLNFAEQNFGGSTSFRFAAVLPLAICQGLHAASPFRRFPKKELFHRQLPLPMHCYDFVPVTDLTVVPREGELRVFPASLT